MDVKDRIKGLFQQAELFVFFFFLITALFLGDGKQPFVDVWFALGILMMYGVRYYQRGKLDLRSLPRLINFAWGALIFYYIILTPFSDSAGYSITATARLIEAYLVYMMFTTISSEKTTALFTKGLLFVGVVATLASFVFLLSPSLANFLPPMSLLYATYGHNHLADLLLFVFPVAIGLVEKKKNVPIIGLLVLFTIGMILTFARGAWVLLVLYLVFLYLRDKNLYLKKIVLVGAAVLVAVFLSLSLLSRNGASAVLAKKAPQLVRLIQKPSLLADGRWEYWRQAIEAIKERPLFGSGPGTFYLESKRLQKAPSSYSWFAHSFPLETMVEVGIVGLFVFIVLICFLFRNSARHPFFWGAVLVFIYSFYEFTLDYTVMWLLVWAALGALTKHNVQTPNRRKINVVACVGGLTTIALFYVSSIGSTAATVLGSQNPAFFLAPHSINTAKEFLEEQKEEEVVVRAATIEIINFFHKRDPEISFDLAKALPDEEEGKSRYFLNSIQLDSVNTEYYKDTIEYLEKRGDKKETVELLVKIIEVLSPNVIHDDPALLNVITENDVVDIILSRVGVWRQTNNPTLGLSKLFYLTGLDLLNVASDKTRLLWRLARDLSPEWSYFHIELASLESHMFADAVGAAATLRYCEGNINAAKHCRMFTKDNLPVVGSMMENIKSVPRITSGL